MARKYEQGDRITCIEEFCKLDKIWWRGKVYDAGFVHSWQLHMILSILQGGGFYRARPIEREKANG